MPVGEAFAADPEDSELIENWMTQWMGAKRPPKGALHVSRFVERIYFLTKPIEWYPNPGQERQFEAVNVPIGFVTDFASIPRVFWSLLPPDGAYTYPAILHDYLYWVQTRPRDVADEIFRIAMNDFRVGSATVFTIYEAVRLGGQSAWDNNARARANGEKRILREFPDDPTTTWEEWKKRSNVFAD
jgi:hypothetical protein